MSSSTPVARGAPPSASLGADARQGANFGGEVAISADGDTALIAAPIGSGTNPDVYIFTLHGGTWSAPVQLDLSAFSAGLGVAGQLSLSADGKTALVGSAVFRDTGGSWSTPVQLGSGQAYSGALSANGDTAVLDEPKQFTDTNTVQIFRFAGSKWTPQKQLAPGPAGAKSGWGDFVAISGDGDTVVARAGSSG